VVVLQAPRQQVLASHLHAPQQRGLLRAPPGGVSGSFRTLPRCPCGGNPLGHQVEGSNCQG
jgi:hypothetical protein